MLAAKVALKNAEAAKQFFKSEGLLSPGAVAFSEASFFFLPLARLPKKKPPFACTYAEKKFASSGRKPFRQLLLDKEILSPAEAEQLVTSFDVIGEIAVIEVPKPLEKKEKKIAAQLLSFLSPRVKTVAKRAGFTRGKFRVRKISVLAGKRTSIALHTENACVFKTDLNRTYFNPRLSHERGRIASLAVAGERVLVLFAGVGPFAIELAKRQPAAKVVAVELNPAAIELMRENVRLNKAGNVEVVAGDASQVLSQKRFLRWADRVVMPLPKGAKKFLPAALKAARKGGVIHYYSIASELEKDVFSRARGEAAAACAKARRRFVFVGGRRVKAYAPRVTQVVLDFKAA